MFDNNPKIVHKLSLEQPNAGTCVTSGSSSVSGPANQTFAEINRYSVIQNGRRLGEALHGLRDFRQGSVTQGSELPAHIENLTSLVDAATPLLGIGGSLAVGHPLLQTKVMTWSEILGEVLAGKPVGVSLLADYTQSNRNGYSFSGATTPFAGKVMDGDHLAHYVVFAGIEGNDAVLLNTGFGAAGRDESARVPLSTLKSWMNASGGQQGETIVSDKFLVWQLREESSSKAASPRLFNTQIGGVQIAGEGDLYRSESAAGISVGFTVKAGTGKLEGKVLVADTETQTALRLSGNRWEYQRAQAENRFFKRSGESYTVKGKIAGVSAYGMLERNQDAQMWSPSTTQTTRHAITVGVHDEQGTSVELTQRAQVSRDKTYNESSITVRKASPMHEEKFTLSTTNGRITGGRVGFFKKL